MTVPTSTTHFTNIQVSGDIYDADGNAFATSDLSDLSAAETDLIDSVTAGTAAAGKAVSLDSNGVVDTFSCTTQTVRAWNATGVQIDKGALVSFVGVDATTGLPKIVLADANTANLKAQGAAQADIATGAAGMVVVRGLSPATLDTSAFATAGDPVYLSETAGAVATAEETEGDEISQVVGYVRVKSNTVGQIVYDFSKTKAIGHGEIQADAVRASELGVTAGTATASRAVVLDTNSAVDVVRTASLRLGASGSEVAVTATAAQINALASLAAIVPAGASTAVGAEAVNAITVGVQLKDYAAADLAVCGIVKCYLSSDAAGDTPVQPSAVDVIPTAGTDGALIAGPTGVSPWYFDFVSESDGDIDVVLTNASDANVSVYLNICNTVGTKVHTSAVCAFIDDTP